MLISSVTLGFATLVALSQDYDKPGAFANGDLNGDGMVNFSDLVLLSQNYNQALPAGGYALSAATATIPSLTLANVRSVAGLAATSPKPTTVKSPAPVSITPFTVTSTRVTDSLDRTKDLVTFYARNNDTGATAGTHDLLAVDATLSSPGGLLIRTYDGDGTGLLDDADYAGENTTPTASFIRVGGPSFLVVSTTPSARKRKYRDKELVSSFEVAGALFGGGIAANSAGGTRIAVAVVAKGSSVMLAGQLAAEKGKLVSFEVTDAIPRR